jgi:hypothetical protein
MSDKTMLAKQMYDALRTVLPNLPDPQAVRSLVLRIDDPDTLPVVDVCMYCLRDGKPYVDKYGDAAMATHRLAVVPASLLDAARHVVQHGCVQGDALLASMQHLADELAKLPK